MSDTHQSAMDIGVLKPRVKRSAGRPPTFTNREEIISEVIERLADGEPLAVICRDSHIPSYDTVYAWQLEREEIAQVISRARLIGFDVIANRARLTLRGKGPDDGGESTGDVQRDKEIANFDLKLLAKWDPKRYGDSMQLKHADADGKKLDNSAQIAELMGLLAGALPAQSGGDDALNVTPQVKSDK